MPQKITRKFVLISLLIYLLPTALLILFFSGSANLASPPKVWIFLGAGLGVSLLAVFLISRAMARSISEMTGCIGEYAQGSFEKKIYVDSEDELKDLGDSVNLMVKNFRDSMQEIESEKTKLAAILENMQEGVVAVGPGKEVMMLNSVTEEIFRSRKTEILGKSLLSAFKVPAIDEMMDEVLGGERRITREIDFDHGGAKSLEVSAIGIKQGEGNIAGLLVLSDISDLKRLQRMRQDFVANVSHELKTPLTSMKGFIETLQAGAADDPVKAREFLKIIGEDAERLNRLINDLLELSKLDSKEEPLNLGPLRLNDQIAGSLAVLQKTLQEREINVRTDYPGEELRVLADPDKLRQVLLNLLDNAIKYSSPKSTLYFETKQAGEFAEIILRDEGPGIPAEALPRLFERFYRVDNARARELGGTGLGLAIVKNIIETHGGSVCCESEAGKGAVFSFTLPLSK